jgi:CxC2 like cysteine cluster associated with KDZ transposases
MMVELVNPRARSVETAKAFTGAGNVSDVVFIVGRVLLNNTHLILCIELRCVPSHMCQGTDFMYPQRWNGSFFMRTSLRDLDLIVHLGHQGMPCPFLGRVLDNFTVVHTNGIHTVKVRLCACYGERSQPKFQLLRCSWLPASTEDPHTAFTFDVLNAYHLLSLQGKVSREDYYLSISRHTDNTGLDPPKVCYYTASEYPKVF